MLFKVQSQNLVTWVILTCFRQKCYLFSNSKLVYRHNDVIMGNMEGFVTLVFFKIESKNLVNWGILMQIFQKVIYFQIQRFYDVSIRHNRYFSRHCNFAIFEGRSSEFGKLGYFDMFIKVSAFHKYYLIC